MQISVFPCYMVAIIVFVAMFLLAVIVSQMISFKPDRSDVAARKVWFWVFGALTLVASFGIDFLVNVNSITVPTLYSKFLIHSCIAAFSALLSARAPAANSQAGSDSNRGLLTH